MEIKLQTLDEERNVTLKAYLLPVGGKFDYIPRRPAVLVIPGGAYEYCSAREEDPVAMRFLAAGFQVFILHYSVGKDKKWPAPLMDYDQAMALIRQNADEWGLYPDKIAVCGFSAGGHLAGAAATMSMNRPNAAILGYPIVSDDVTTINPTAPDVTKAVDDKTCPCFIFHARDDDSVPVSNSVKMMAALNEAGVTYEAHIYPCGGHGFSTGDSSVQSPAKKRSLRLEDWVPNAISFLREIFGDFSADGAATGSLAEPVLEPVVGCDRTEFLSVENTVGRILQVPAGRDIIYPILRSMSGGGSKGTAPGDGTSDNAGAELPDLVRGMKLENLLHFAGAPREAIDKINARLTQIANEVVR